MTARTTSLELRVRYGETYQMGVVYHANYLIWCELGRTEHIRALGIPYRDIERMGVRLAVAEATLRYHAPARYDDVIRVETTLETVRSRHLDFSYVIALAAAGQRLASARTALVSLDMGGRVVAMPRELRDALAAKDAATE
ncbi:MAG: thioesterase family protein [Gemmatimonadaceae bacterium]